MIADFNKKQKMANSENKIAFQIAGVLFIIIIITLAIGNLKMYQRKKDLISQIDSYKKQIEEIEKSSKDLKNSITNSDNQDYIEKIAYEQLGEQKPGEKEVIFVAPQKKTEVSPASQNFWDFKYWFGWISQPWAWIKSKI